MNYYLFDSYIFIMEMIVLLLDALVLGIVEGLTEWLPISSTGHLLIFGDLTSLKEMNIFYMTFIVVIQLAAVLAVFTIFINEFVPQKHTTKEEMRNVYKPRYIKIMLGILPSGILGLVFDDLIDQYFYKWYIVCISLIFFGFVVILIEIIQRKKNVLYKEDISYKDACLIGFSQVIAMCFPGTSRSGITIIAALLLHIRREEGCKFSFLISVPTMLGASLLKLMKFTSFAKEELILLFTGCIVSFLVSYIVVRLFLDYVKKRSFTIFGVYRIIVGFLIAFFYLKA